MKNNDINIESDFISDNRILYKTRNQMLLFFLKGCKLTFAISIFFACLLVLFELVNPRIIGYTIDICVGDISSLPIPVQNIIYKIGGREYIMSHLYIIAGIVVFISLIGGIFRYLFQLFNSMGAERLTKRMRDTLFEHIINLPYKWHDENKTGDIIQRCTSDVDMIKNFISEQLTSLFRMSVMILMALFFMSRLHFKLTLVAFIFIPIVIAYSFLFHDKIGSSFEKIDAEEGKLSAIAQENLTGVRVVRAFGREKYERNRFEEKNRIYTGMWVKMMQILSTFWITNDIISGVETLSIISIGAYFAINNEMSAGSYVAFLSYNALLIFPVRQLGRIISEMSKAGISVDRLMYIMNSEKETDSPDAIDYPGSGDICFENVSFSYDEKATTETMVLNNVSFNIKKGQTVGILGGTGSGKSTLVHLLDRLYEIPDKNGKITLSGINIKDIKRSELRKHIGLVLQEPYLFSRTLEDNIKIAAKEATHENVEKAVETASLTSAIEHFSEGYDTYIGERGVTLSGGQKQRTAIAQTIIRKPDILIFDDSLSAVDAQTDVKIRKELEKAAGDSTVIIISHRITTLMQADLILVLENGRIKEQGTHNELLSMHGIYDKIFHLQLSQGE